MFSNISRGADVNIRNFYTAFFWELSWLKVCELRGNWNDEQPQITTQIDAEVSKPRDCLDIPGLSSEYE